MLQNFLRSYPSRERLLLAVHQERGQGRGCIHLLGQALSTAELERPTRWQHSRKNHTLPLKQNMVTDPHSATFSMRQYSPIFTSGGFATARLRFTLPGSMDIKKPGKTSRVFVLKVNSLSALARRRQVRAHAFVHFGALLPTYRSIHPASGAGGWSCRCRCRRSPFRWPARFRRFIVHLSPACVPTMVRPMRLNRSRIIKNPQSLAGF